MYFLFLFLCVCLEVIHVIAGGFVRKYTYIGSRRHIFYALLNSHACSLVLTFALIPILTHKYMHARPVHIYG